MSELAPALMHPKLNASISELLAALKSPHRVTLARADLLRPPPPQAGGSDFAMKFFIDTADVNEIREAASWGLVDGVTTNPSLIAKTGRPYAEVLREICEIVDGPVSAEVVATEARGDARGGREARPPASQHRGQMPAHRRGTEGHARAERTAASRST